MIATPPRNACPGYSDSSVGPSAAMRACTAFCAPLPSATIVMTAPTPMMMPSIVRNDRSLLARIAWSATWKISPRSILGPRRRLRPLLRGRLLLLDTRQAAARHLAHALLHVALRVEQRCAGQHENGILLHQAAHDLDVVEIGEPRTDLHRRRLPLPQDEDDVARRLAGVAAEAAAARTTAATPPARAHHHLAHGCHRRLLGRRQLLARHALLERGPDYRFGHPGRQLNRPAIGGRHRVTTGRWRSRIAFGRGIAPRRAATQRRTVTVDWRLRLLARGLGLDLQDTALERAIGIRVHGDGRQEARRHLADIRLVHERADLYRVEVRHLEQHRAAAHVRRRR